MKAEPTIIETIKHLWQMAVAYFSRLDVKINKRLKRDIDDDSKQKKIEAVGLADESQISKLLQTVTTQPKRGSGAYYYRMLEICRARILLIWALMGITFISLMLRTIALPFTETRGAVNDSSSNTRPALRSDIVDRNGNILVSSAIVKSLNADVTLMRRANVDFADAASRLATLLPAIDQENLLDKFNRLAHFPIIQRLAPEQVWQVRQLGIPGIYTLREEGRIYPYGDLMAHVVGFVDNNNVGQSGIELRFNSLLSRGEAPFALSVDVRMQYILAEALQKAFDTQKAKSACGLVMSLKSSEILAMTSFPTFNPHQINKITNDKYFNCTTQSVYELGSTMKLINAALGLEMGTATLDTVYDTTRPIRIENKVISDIRLSEFRYNLRQVMTYSSNIGSALIARDAGAVRQREFLQRLGMLSVSPIELEGKGIPLIANEKDELTTMTIGFGHSIAVSPLHLASAVSLIINDGIYRKPTLLYIPEVQRALAPGVRVVRSEVSDALRQIMYLVVRDGTGRAAKIPGYVVGGKTGTAEKLVETSLGLRYSSNAVLSSFIAAYPMHDPQYLIYVLIDEPKGNNVFGGAIMAPVVKEIIQKMAPMVGVTPYNERSPEILKALGLNKRGQPIAVSE